MNDLDVWHKLWDIATDCNLATITPDPEDEGRVKLTYLGGEVAYLYWDDGNWQFEEQAQRSLAE